MIFMKPMRYLLLTAVLTFAVFSVITWTACNKNKCHNVVCLNNGECDGGKCVCPVGFEGLRCEILRGINLFLITMVMIFAAMV